MLACQGIAEEHIPKIPHLSVVLENKLGQAETGAWIGNKQFMLLHTAHFFTIIPCQSYNVLSSHD